MAFNGSGTFNRLYTWVIDAANGIKIRADRMDAEMDGFATGLTDCVTRDGQSPWLANIPAGGFRITDLADGVQATDSATVSQVQNSKTAFAIAAGTAQVITAAFTPTFVTLTDGMQLNVRALLANTAAAPTFAPDAIAAHPITKLGGVALVAGDIYGPLHEMVLRYNLANTRWELLNPSGKNLITLTTTGAVDVGGSFTSGGTVVGIDRNEFVFGGATNNGVGFNDNSATTGCNFNVFRTAGTSIGAITANGSNTGVVYNTTSDERLKDWDIDQQNYWEKIKAVWIGDFEWKWGGDFGFGVRAQQAYEVLGPLSGITPPTEVQGLWRAPSEPFGLLALWGVQKLRRDYDDLLARLETLERKL